MNSKQIREMVLDENIKSRFGLSAAGSVSEGEVLSAEANVQEPKKREQDINNPGRDAFDAKHDGNPNAASALPFTSPNAVDIPVPENPVDVKIGLNDAVDFITRWEKAKPEEMRPAFAESHLRNIAMEDYLTELKARTQAAQQLGQSQILLPMMPNAVFAGEAKTANREDDDYGKKIMATLAPFIATQKLFGMNDDNTQAEKPTEVAKTIMDMGKSMAELKGNNQAEQPKITEVIDSVISAAEKLSGGSGGGKSKTEELTEIIKLAEILSNRKDDSGKINVPNPDGTFTEMPASQYLISQLLAAKNEGGKSSEGVKPDMVTITDPEGNVKHMPTAVYMAEQMMNKGKPSDNTSRDEPPTSKLLSALVGTVERLSTNMNDMQRRLSEQSNPLGMMKRLKQESDEWNQFREGFMGSAGSTQSEREAMEEKKREHELELEKINARKESSMALASMMQLQQQPTPVDTAPELNTAEDFHRDMNERLLLSQQKAKAFSNFNVQPQSSEVVKDTGGEKKKHGRK